MKKIVLIFLFGCYITYSQNVVIDNSFGTNGSVLTENTTGMSKTIIIEDDKFISVGSKTITTTPYVHTAVLAKYNSDGSLDSAFASIWLFGNIAMAESEHDAPLFKKLIFFIPLSPKETSKSPLLS